MDSTGTQYSKTNLFRFLSMTRYCRTNYNSLQTNEVNKRALSICGRAVEDVLE